MHNEVGTCTEIFPVILLIIMSLLFPILQDVSGKNEINILMLKPQLLHAKTKRKLNVLYLLHLKLTGFQPYLVNFALLKSFLDQPISDEGIYFILE